MQVASPGLEHGQQAQLSAEIFVSAPDIEQCRGTFAQEQWVKDFLVGPDDLSQLSRDGESDQVIGNGQQTSSLSMQPLCCIGLTALGAGAMIAGVINQHALSASAAEELSAQSGSAAAKNGVDGALMREEQARAKLAFIRRPMPAQDCGQGDHSGPIRL
jgi:hypothetical protein